MTGADRSVRVGERVDLSRWTRLTEHGAIVVYTGSNIDAGNTDIGESDYTALVSDVERWIA